MELATQPVKHLVVQPVVQLEVQPLLKLVLQAIGETKVQPIVQLKRRIKNLIYVLSLFIKKQVALEIFFLYNV